MARLTTINNAGNQITQINQFTPTSMSCNDFLFNPNKRGIWESSYLFLSEEHQALISAPSVQQGRKKKKRKKKASQSVHAVQERHITHRHAIWTTNDSHQDGHQSGSYCSSVFINLDQASRIPL